MSAVDETGMVYALSFEDRHAYAISRPSASSRGTAVWTYPFNCSPEYSALGADGTLYVGCRNGDLFAVSKASGGSNELKWIWRDQDGGGVLSFPAVGADGTVFVGTDDGSLHAISPPVNGTDGVEKWVFQLQSPGPQISSPAIGADGTVCIGSADGYVYAIR
jgi:outer membrane protein assembly factor BamB